MWHIIQWQSTITTSAATGTLLIIVIIMATVHMMIQYKNVNDLLQTKSTGYKSFKAGQKFLIGP